MNPYKHSHQHTNQPKEIIVSSQLPPIKPYSSINKYNPTLYSTAPHVHITKFNPLNHQHNTPGQQPPQQPTTHQHK